MDLSTLISAVTAAQQKLAGDSVKITNDQSAVANNLTTVDTIQDQLTQANKVLSDSQGLLTSDSQALLPDAQQIKAAATDLVAFLEALPPTP